MKSDLIQKLAGPIAIFGTAGFVGSHLLAKITQARQDVIGLSSNPQGAWRLKKLSINKKHIARCNLLNFKETKTRINHYRPKTIFNLAAYGAYSWQSDWQKIYQTNLLSSINLLEALKNTDLKIYVQTGSQSEYGFNSNAPKEEDVLYPNSHYAVSKIAMYYALKYYCHKENFPGVHLRLYSVYGPLEEPGRLIATLIENVRQGKLPPFVNPDISRDFIYIDDVIDALLTVAYKSGKKHYGEAYNIATGRKTTMADLAKISQKLFRIDKKPKFGTMKQRAWDLTNWVGDSSKIKRDFGFVAKTSLEQGLKKSYEFELRNTNEL